MTTNENSENAVTALQELWDILDAETPEYTKEQREADAAAHRAMLDEASRELEARMSGWNLSFTQDFRGACPMQAFGWINGERFYFRYRNDVATLLVGTVDPEIARKNYEHDRTVKAQSMVDFVAGNRELGEEERKEMFERFANKAVMASNNDADAYPTKVTARASLGNIRGNAYAGALETKQEIMNTFAVLASRLEPVEQKGNA